MLRRALGITAVCALGASAFLLPPGVAPASHDEKHGLTASVLDPSSTTITLPCPDCGAFSKQQEEKSGDVDDKAEGEDDLYWIQDDSPELALHFTVSEDAHRLHLGGDALYPLPAESEGAQKEQFQVALTKRDATSNDGASTLEVSASALNVAAQPVSDNGDTILTLTFQILVVDEHPVTVNSVELTILQTGTGELLIMDARAHGEPADFFPPPPPPPFDAKRPHKQCERLPAPLCRLKNMIESKITGLNHGKPGGCRGRKQGHFKQMPGHIKAPHFPGPDHDGDREDHPHGPPPPPHHGRPHHGRPHHGPPHGPHEHHGPHGPPFLHAFVRGFIAVLIPIMAGVAVGFAVSVIGVLVGRLISFLWIKFARGGRRGYASVSQTEAADVEDVNVVGEKEGFVVGVAEMDAPPPMYQDAPAYEEVEKEVK